MATLIADRDFGMQVALSGLKQRNFEPEVIFDIGAADGEWARMVLHLWSTTRVVCFEPLAERVDLLNNLKSQYPERVSVFNVGLSDVDGELSLGVTEGLYDSSFAYAGSSSRKVQVRRLDSLFEEGAIPRPSLVKVDVQGFEKRVLDGGPIVIDAASLVLLECQFLPFCGEMRTLDQTISHMSRIGFIPYEFVDLLRRPLDGAMGQCDILFVKKDHFLVRQHRWA